MAGRLKVLAAGAVVTAGLSGCVNQQEYDSLYSTNRALEERNVMLQQELEAEKNASTLLRDRVLAADSAVAEARNRNTDLQSQLLRLREDYRNLTSRLNNIAVTPLDPVTDDALRKLAAANSDIMRYDASRGMIQLTSDLTFALGSTEVTSGARAALQRVAQIMSTPEASKYDARIVGHTDNVPIGRPETRQKHPTNVHLSVHRAIAVRDVLVQSGVPAARLEASGWGEFRPVVANAGNRGAAANRRVEIYLVPTTAGETLVEASTAPVTETTPVREANADEPLK